jgi:uncharacterized protein (TIGR03083 family)
MEIRDAIAAERGDLAAMLSKLAEADWDRATLCEGWRVREVVAHMTITFRSSSLRLLGGMVRARGNFNRMADRTARHDAAVMSAGELVAAMEQNIRHPWKPLGGGYEGALSHDVIHGLDISVALGLGRRIPEERLRIVMGIVQSPRARKFFGVDLEGIELCADDMEWSFGEGALVSGTAQDLLLVVCGRRLPEGHLAGAASGRFTSD